MIIFGNEDGQGIIIYETTSNQFEKYDYGIFARLEGIDHTRAGWLKPHRQLVSYTNHLKITYNLPRGRAREKKQIFLKAA